MGTRQERNIYQGCYGASAKSSEVKKWIKQSILSNIGRQSKGMPRCTISIWGAPGTSKTSIVKSLQNEEVEFDGVLQKIRVVDIPLAQIEEMGDVTGFPVDEIEMKSPGVCNKNIWIRPLNSIVEKWISQGYEETGNQRTIYAPPAWVPKEECPGVILFDDGNRASQRIMKGLMQLVQDYRTIAWSIPRGWTIIFTGNPDNRYNQVTSMDTAQLTRMKHITLEVDAKEWAIWAQENEIDDRGINFVLRYPEMIIGKERTNPRSLTEFFYSLKSIRNLQDKDEFRRFTIEANASLDEETVAVMTSFLMRDVELVIDPEMILENPKEAEKHLKRLMDNNEPRVDIVSVTIDRLIAFLLSNNYQFKEEHMENFQNWMLNKLIPQDLVFSALHIIAKSGWKYSRQFIKGKELLSMVLDLLKKE